MDKVSLNDKTYIKASVIARELGYTTDYVGQLCRAKKVDAQLIGRSWYVNEDSIHAHKKTRYRSDKKVVSRELQKKLTNSDDSQAEERHLKLVKSKKKSGQNFYSYHSSTIHTPKYISDESELLPKLKTKELEVSSGIIEVELADAEKVEVTTKEKETKFESSEPKKVKFKGKLKVESAEDELSHYDSEEEVGENESLTTQEPEKPEEEVVADQDTDSLDNMANNNIISDRNPSADAPKSRVFSDIVTLSEPDNIAEPTKEAEKFSKIENFEESVEETVQDDVVYLPPSKLSLLVLILSIFSAFAISVALLAVDSVLSVDSVLIVTQYELNFTKTWEIFLELFN